MVDFGKLVTRKAGTSFVDPVTLYDTLDRASDKGELRKAQAALLAEWHSSRRGARDTIIKLHTGQGKTLIGLLILQSKLNELGQPAVYLCPNNHLVEQTCMQARQFGVPYVTADEDLPDEFLAGSRLLITSVQKLFNGLTKFRLGPRSVQVSTLLMDDAHACVDAVRDACAIRLAREEQPYADLLALFQDDLEAQGAGTLADIRNMNFDALLPVPYWAWAERVSEVVRVLSAHTDKKSIRFAWPLLKDTLAHCQCVISGDSLEITPYLPPLHLFGTYDRAKHRVFMSATDADDAFLVKGLRLAAATISNPLVYAAERWSGEKMVLIPSLLDESLDRDAIVNAFGQVVPGRPYGVVALTPSFNKADAQFWEKCGAAIAKTKTIYDQIESLKAGRYDQPLVIANRYDGIDLPDQACRILVFDSRPFFESLLDRYMEACIGDTDVITRKAARRIEQGLGRSVRGEKDYSVIVLTGSDLVRLIRSKDTRRHFSQQTQAQIELGLAIADLARADVAGGEEPMRALQSLIGQCLGRDSGWKDAYRERMDAIRPEPAERHALDVFESELLAERKYQEGNPDEAVAVMQKLIDTRVHDAPQRGWYVQEMARYRYGSQRVESNRLQLAAHAANPFLLKPTSGVQVVLLHPIALRRAGAIIEFVRAAGSYEQLTLTVLDIVSGLGFGVKFDRFEKAFNDLGRALGFSAERPDKSWKEGPDNLWALRDDEYLLVECKSEVLPGRVEINKDEVVQMIKASGWFKKHYKAAKVKRLMVIPTLSVGRATAFTDEVEIVRAKSLSKLVMNVKAFFGEFRAFDLKGLSEAKVQQLLDAHDLGIEAVVSSYSEPVRIYG